MGFDQRLHGGSPPAAPVYSWTILDRIFDTYVEAGITPFVQAGFMPEALSTGPRPTATTSRGPASRPVGPGRRGTTTAGANLIEAWARHLVERYGMARVKDLALGNLERAGRALLARLDR